MSNFKMQESGFLIKNSIRTKTFYLTNNIQTIKINTVYM